MQTMEKEAQERERGKRKFRFVGVHEMDFQIFAAEIETSRDNRPFEGNSIETHLVCEPNLTFFLL